MLTKSVSSFFRTLTPYAKTTFSAGRHLRII
jgi:hypothetical protein